MSNRWAAYVGYYAMFGLVVQVAERGTALMATFPGAPPGYGMALEPEEQPNTFRLASGQLAGALIRFKMDATGKAHEAHVDEFELKRITESEAAGGEFPERLLLPEMSLDMEKQRTFTALRDSILAQPDGDWIPYNLPFPKHEFVRFLSAGDKFVFHGSNNSQIEVFQPVRNSFELRDSSGRGNLQAVYGTHDAIWAMFFAVVDRKRLSGSIRNGVFYLADLEGHVLPVYNFSINREMLPARPYCKGTLYLLPRETFRRLPMGTAWSNEWASEEPVRPVARLALEPEDFPFLEQIGGHDDSELKRAGELQSAVFAAVESFEPLEDGFLLTLPWNSDMAMQVDAFLEVHRSLMPAATFQLEVDSAGHSARLALHVPPAVRQVLEVALRK